MLNQPATATQITHLQRLWLYGLVGAVLLFLIVPCLIVVPMSFSGSQYLEFPPRSWSLRWYEAYLASPEWRAATSVSIRVALITTALATALGTLAAYGLVRVRSALVTAGRAVFMLPMLVPLILVAIGCFFVYARLGLNSTITGLVLAHTVLALPFVVIAVSSGLASYDMNQERVAQSLGASRPWAFLTVTLPQIKLSVVSGALFAFVTSFDEVVVALFVSSGETATLTRLMFANIRDQIDPTVAAISSLLIGLSILLLLGSQLLQRAGDSRQ
ncbi:ABC transporter permease [Rhodoligotrophos defluvii]|uniref:ABC transporter permease n=1 Tax=Rhodoligotrophos defluvii TaxID=2561934 RepID=UPI0010CA1577|nr:ABC transporter permease [Rhodoligotrophos defluvii]